MWVGILAAALLVPIWVEPWRSVKRIALCLLAVPLLGWLLYTLCASNWCYEPPEWVLASAVGVAVSSAIKLAVACVRC